MKVAIVFNWKAQALQELGSEHTAEKQAVHPSADAKSQAQALMGE